MGTCPAVRIPASHNAGDFGASLVNAPHEYALTKEELEKRTDGHMDINEAVEGSIVIAPVKVPGAGIYIGDVHAMMGDGEIAGHTADVSTEVVLEVKVIKGLELDGPIVLPVVQDLPDIVRARTEEELEAARLLANIWFELEYDSLPFRWWVVASINAAADNALNG